MENNYQNGFTHEYFWEQARIESKKSTDLRRSIGVVVVNEKNEIIGRGSNQATIPWFWVARLHKKYCIRKIVGVKKNTCYFICPGCALYRNHAEVRALRSIKYPEYNLKYMKLRIYMFGHKYCCNNCLKKISMYNIEKIYVKDSLTT